MKECLIFLILATTTCFAQELKTKKKSSDFYKEIYTVVKKTKQKQGEYVKINTNSKDTLIKGNYDENKRTGIWTFYGKENEVYLKYDYEMKAVKFLNLPEQKDSLHIRSEKGFKFSVVDSYPLFIGFKNEIIQIMNLNFDPPKSVFNNQESGMAMASFVINKEGELGEVTIENSFNKEMGPAIEKSLEFIKESWVPAYLNGKAIDSKIYIVYNIVTTKDPEFKHQSTFVEQADVIVIDLIYLGIDRERRI